MKRMLLVLLLFFAATAVAEQADLVLRHGRIYTMDAARSWAESIAVHKGRIVYVGPDADLGPWVGAGTKTVDLKGRFVLPGFIDGHVHPVSAGIDLGRCQLDEAQSKDEVLQIIREYAAGHKDSEWIIGTGWQLPVFPDANPRKEWLDEIVPDKPVMMISADGHSAWVNSRALQLAKISKDTPDPDAGRIEKDEKGEPTGTLRESAADLVYDIAPKPSLEENVEALKTAVAHLNGLGITGFIEASASEMYLNTYREADKRGFLTAHVMLAMYVDPEKPLDQIEQLKKWRSEYNGKNYRSTSAKIFVDGVIEANTAAMLEPYLDQNHSGILNWEPARLKSMVEALDREKFQIHIHAIGDRGIRESLDALEAAQNKHGRRDGRPMIVHLQAFSPADVPRFASIGVIPCFQALWAYADPYITDLAAPKLGPERLRWNYPIRSVAATGATMAMGSDWNVSSANPLDAIKVAVTREDPEAEKPTGNVFVAEEKIDLASALAAYTIGSAYALFREKETGTLETGKYADLIVLSENIFEIPPHRINQARVLLTLLEGKEVYRSSDWKE